MADQAPEVKIKFVKKKGGHGGAHGGAWKVAYADLVTAMMAFFLLMWLLSSANANTKAGIAGYMKEGEQFFDTPQGKLILENHGKGILPGGRGLQQGPDGEGGPAADPAEELRKKEEEAMQATATAIEQAFKDDALLTAFKDQINLQMTEEGLRVEISDKAASVLFDSGSAQLKAYTLSILKEIAKELGKLQNQVVIGGHTDSQQYAGQAYTNWELSAERANAARRVLTASGLRPEQVRRVTGYAATIPAEGKKPDDPANRRISIVVLSSATAAAEEKRQQSHKPLEKGKDPEQDKKAAGHAKQDDHAKAGKGEHK